MTAARAIPADPTADEQRRLRLLTLEMLDHHPFWGHVLVQLELIPEPQLPTLAATDCVRRIWFNPRFTSQLPLRELGFVLAHEVGHIVLLSAERRGERDLWRWNQATDYAINRMVRSMRHPGTREPLYAVPNSYVAGLGDVRPLLGFDVETAETIYEILAATDPEPELHVLDLGDGTIVVADHEGGGLDVHVQVEDAAEARSIVEAAQREWEAEGRRGNAPGSTLRRLAAGPRAHVSWVEELAAILLQSAGRTEYDARRPNRRWLDEDIIVPSLTGGEPPPIVVALDTSGSMTPAVLAAVGAELRSLAAFAPDITLIVADAAVQEVVPSRELDRFLAAGRIRGGGGTDHRPVFAWIAEHLPPPALFVGLTDLFSRFPKAPPGYPVLWVAPPRHGRAPWGRVLVTGDRS